MLKFLLNWTELEDTIQNSQKLGGGVDINYWGTTVYSN